MESVRIATRQSALALWQTDFVKAQLLARHPHLNIEIIGLTTKGDQILDQPLAKIGGKGLFVKELETALFDHRADIAVHSMKDVPMDLPEGLEIPVICERADPRDAFVSNSFASLNDLPKGARLGTSSVRRRSQLAALRPDLKYLDLRGNVGTRLGKLDAGEYEAIILAVAGLERLALHDRIRARLSTTESIPAAGQGAVGIECREGDGELKALLSELNHPATATCVIAERAVSRGLNANCEAPVAAYAELLNNRITVRALVASLDGQRVMIETASGSPAEAEQLGKKLAAMLIEKGALELIG